MTPALSEVTAEGPDGASKSNLINAFVDHLLELHNFVFQQILRMPSPIQSRLVQVDPHSFARNRAAPG